VPSCTVYAPTHLPHTAESAISTDTSTLELRSLSSTGGSSHTLKCVRGTLADGSYSSKSSREVSFAYVRSTGGVLTLLVRAQQKRISLPLWSHKGTPHVRFGILHCFVCRCTLDVQSRMRISILLRLFYATIDVRYNSRVVSMTQPPLYTDTVSHFARNTT